jgi:hypothetical protein
MMIPATEDEKKKEIYGDNKFHQIEVNATS